MQHLLRYQNATLSYHQSGHGENVLLLFHGFGQQHQAFASLAKALSTHVTLYSIDLFFHGDSRWEDGELPLEKTRWIELMTQLLHRHDIKKFSVLGFSLGGKFALVTLEGFRERIEHLYLLAPDGIKTNFWYQIATYPWAMRQFFKSMILNPGRFQAITAVLDKLHLMDRKLLRFAASQMDTEEKRHRVYYSWVVFRHLQVDVRSIAQIIKDHSISLLVITGKHDQVIPTKHMQPLLRFFTPNHLMVVDAGHHGVINGSIPVLLTLIRQ